MSVMEKYFYEAFENMERLGPGCETSTEKAISYIEKVQPIKILDIGCGVGTHTFIMGNKLKNAEIIAIDNNQEFINKLNSTAKSLGLSDRVNGICMSMFEMTFEENAFDYIFAEGAIYIAGFTEALSDWKRLLKKDGIIICSEISWTVPNLSEKIKSFWELNYPQIDTITNKITQAENLGYSCITNFSLPNEAWTDNYYIPLARNLDLMRKKYSTNEDALEVISIIQEEIDLYYKYNKEYNYVFYVFQLK